jgi:hypothetical protein
MVQLMKDFLVLCISLRELIAMVLALTRLKPVIRLLLTLVLIPVPMLIPVVVLLLAPERLIAAVVLVRLVTPDIIVVVVFEQLAAQILNIVAPMLPLVRRLVRDIIRRAGFLMVRQELAKLFVLLVLLAPAALLPFVQGQPILALRVKVLVQLARPDIIARAVFAIIVVLVIIVLPIAGRRLLVPPEPLQAQLMLLRLAEPAVLAPMLLVQGIRLVQVVLVILILQHPVKVLARLVLLVLLVTPDILVVLVVYRPGISMLMAMEKEYQQPLKALVRSQQDMFLILMTVMIVIVL